MLRVEVENKTLTREDINGDWKEISDKITEGARLYFRSYFKKDAPEIEITGRDGVRFSAVHKINKDSKPGVYEVIVQGFRDGGKKEATINVTIV